MSIGDTIQVQFLNPLTRVRYGTPWSGRILKIIPTQKRSILVTRFGSSVWITKKEILETRENAIAEK